MTAYAKFTAERGDVAIRAREGRRVIVERGAGAVAERPALVVWSEDPLNAETPAELVCRSATTPTDVFYVRNHGPVPEVDPAAYRLGVGGLVRVPLALTLGDLRRRFERATVTAALTCAGNRRRDLAQVAPIPGQVPWGCGATGNATWAGVRLRDVLLAARLEPGAGHVAFTGLDEVEEDGDRLEFGGSIPLDRALGHDVLLADEMNGQPLSALHGYPLRVVVPGYIGARSVKWLSSVTVRREPSTNPFQARTYTLLPTSIGGRAAGRGIALGELPVNSAICRPRDGQALVAPRVAAQGYALTGGTRRIERVELSLDRGETFVAAELLDDGAAGSWRRWRADLEVEPGACELVVRAWDSAAVTQPEDPAKLWNAKGYVNNAWHRVRFSVVRAMGQG